MKKIFSKILLVIFLAGFFVVQAPAPAKAAPATLFLSPGSGAYPMGKSFSLKVMVNSGGEAGINAAEGVIKFDPSIVTVSGIADTGSIFKLWTTDPTFSNSAGTISFGGGSPGAYKGDAGLIFTVTMSSKKTGTADMTWTSGIVLAADGKGTNVFGGYGHGKYTIEEEKKEEVKPKDETTAQPERDDVKGIRPPLPDVSSPSHPDSEKWYTANTPEFAWKVLSDLTGVSYSVTNEAASDPGAENDGIVESTKFDNQADGEWYFHIKYQNRYGFGQIAHYKFRIDATAPEAFAIALDNGNDSTNPTPKLRFKTEDKTSGISHYLVQTGVDIKQVSPEDVKNGYYQTGVMKPGQYTTAIAAIDLAGNTASSTITYAIDALKSPVITDIPKTIDKKQELIIRGTSFYPQVKIKVYIDDGEIFKEYTTMTDDNGNWSYFHGEKMEKGSYEVYARVIDDRGAESLDSSHHILTVISPSLVDSYGLWIILILIIIIIALILYIIYREIKFVEEKQRIKAETEEVKSKLSKIFAALREEVDELIELSDKRPGLSEAERRIKEKLQESLDISEEFIVKEVEDVEKEIKLKKPKVK